MNKTYEHYNGKRICITDLGHCFHYRCAKTKRELFYRFDKEEDLYKVYTKEGRTVYVNYINEWEKMHDFICQELTAERDEEGFIIHS